MSMTKYWVWLSLCQSLSERKVTALLDASGSAEDIFSHSARQLAQRVELSPKQMQEIDDKDLTQAKHTMEYCVERGIRMITLADTNYPDHLRLIPDPPAMLYAKGRIPIWEEEIAIGVVGTREPSAYGMAATERLSRILAQSGFWIVSGLAAGIDSAAHRGALKAGGQTIAVLGCGVDICYPKENQRLRDDIVATGLVLSEFPPGSRPEPHHFPRRNRIISGLSSGVIVGEAPKRSGALITAALALEQGKDVFAVPFPIDTPIGEGGNNLIRQGEAQMVTSPWDIAVVYEGQMRSRLQQMNDQQGWTEAQVAKSETTKQPEPEPQRERKQVKLDGLSEAAQQIVNAVFEGAGTVDEISETSGLSPTQILPEITLLEMEGLLVRQQGRLTLAPQY